MSAFTDQLDALLEDHPAASIVAAADTAECEQIVQHDRGEQLAGWIFYAGVRTDRRPGAPTARVITPAA
jgi:hypothetical protein